MRPGQNRRMRGRNNNNNNNSNRRGPNPLSRPYESNGPDVKVRGTAQHIAEKYLQLARDAQSSGDHVMAENYLQHAEHYFRIVLAAQELLAEQTGQQFPPQRPFGEEDGEDGEDGEGGGNPGGQAQQGYGQGERQQGRNEPRQQDNRNGDTRYDSRQDNRQDRQDRPQYDRNQEGDRPRGENRGDQGYRGDRQDNRQDGRGEFRQDRNQQDRNQQDRPERQDRNQQDRPERQDRNERFERRPRFERDRPERGERNDQRPQQGGFDPANEPQPSVTVEPRFRPRQPEPEDETGGLPAFVTAPVPRPVINATPPEAEAHDDHSDDAPAAAAPRKRGRPRKDRSEAGPVEG